MLYPEIINIKKSNAIIKFLIVLTIMLSGICIAINLLTTQSLNWSLLVVLGFVYVWITTLYSIYRNVNIAAHVMLQLLTVSAVVFLIDYILGYKGWSLEIAIPIIIIIANVTMLVLTVVSRKRYFKYAISQIVILLFSLCPIFFMLQGIIQFEILTVISTCISVGVFIVVLILCGRQVLQTVKRNFHM